MEIVKNISLKIKPFVYGRRIRDFHPVQRARPCANKILGVLASGSVIPCCMAYDDTFSLGDVNKDSLSVILERSSGLLSNIRVKGTNLPPDCQHCLGAPTKRGAMLKKLRYAFRRG